MTLIGAVMLVGACEAGPAAFAGVAWTRPVAGRVLVAYGEVCPGPSGSGVRTHQGVDLACAAGETAIACEGGTVAFAGPVPGDCGGRVLAVTVTGDDGLRITYSPLATAAGAAGRRVEAGSAIGAVAAQGDSSSATPHVHLSVRRGESYLDPSGMLAGAASMSGGASTSGVSGRESPGGGAQPAALAAAAAQAAASRGPASTGAPAAQTSMAHASAAAAAPVAVQAGALATLAALHAAPAVTPAAAVRAVTGRISLLAPMPARAGLLVPPLHATGLAAIAGSVSSLEKTAMVAAMALVIGLAALACVWRTLRLAAGSAASAATAGSLTPAPTTPQRRA